jgi:branched-chain amino acid transport system permease protein
MRDIIHRLRGGLIPLVTITVLLVVLPIAGMPRSWTLYLFLFFIYLAMANMWNLLAGYSGLISLCQPAFIGLAGYTLVIFTWIGLPFYLGIIAGALVAAAFAILISIPVFRLSGIYFAIGTLVIPEALRIVFFLWRPVGGELHGGGAGYMVKGVTGVSMTEFYWLALVIGMASIFLMRLILRSKLGLGLASIRDNDRTAASCGIDVFRLKLYSFVIGAFVTGIAGGIFYIYQGYIEPASAFNIRWTMVVMLATVIGGMSTEEGPIVGTAIVVFLHFLLARYAGISLLIQGIILVGIMLLAPQGIMGLIRKTRTYRSMLQLATGP